MELEDRINESRRLLHITSNEAISHDLIRSLCGAHLGAGIHRTVYEYNLDPDKYVIKLQPCNNGTNRREYDLWNEIKWYTGKLDYVKKWFAPCVWISPNGRVLVQRRTKVISPKDHHKLPDKIPAFLTDTKYANLGFIGKQLVSHDYAMVLRGNFTKKMVPKSNIWDHND